MHGVSRLVRPARSVLVTASALALVLPSSLLTAPAGADAAPRGRPSPAGTVTAGASAVTAAARAEIDRVVAAGRVAGRTSAARALSSSARSLVDTQARCASFEGQQYCLHVGWTADSAAEVAARALREDGRDRLLRARSLSGATTGDVTLLGRLRAAARLSPAARAAADRAELTAAARAVAKVWLLRHQIQGVPLPRGFLKRHPEVATQAGTETGTETGARGWRPGTPVKSWADYPGIDVVIPRNRVSEQIRNYWCGPSAMQMIAWGWSGRVRTQAFWADRLGTTTDGSAITEMVRVTNESTGWDNARRAGPYVALDISNLSYYQWWMLNLRHVHDYRAPLVYHPVLLKEFYPYLDDDASGHFQVGRGYSKNGPRPPLVSFFEPYNQQRFDPSEPYIPRVQWRWAYRSFRANQEHFQHNIGV